MDPSQIDLRSIPDKIRFKIFDYIWSKGIGSSELDIDPTYANKIKNRRVRVSDRLLARIIKFLSIEGFANLMAGRKPMQYTNTYNY